MPINIYDVLIQALAKELFTSCDWRLIKAQVARESGFNPAAVSPCGALGLLQLMPLTAKECFGLSAADLLIPGTNLRAGIKYLRMQSDHLSEIADSNERLKFALAAYNCGRGYVNKALELAYKAEHGIDMPAGHRGALPGKWQTWNYTKKFLDSPACVIGGKTPDAAQVTNYVDRIWARYEGY